MVRGSEVGIGVMLRGGAMTLACLSSEELKTESSDGTSA